MTALLTTAGIHVVATDDPDDVQRLVEAGEVDVAVIDCDTPRPEAGLTLVTMVRRHAPTIPVVLLMSRQVLPLAIAGVRAGVADIVVKAPESVSYLTDTVVRLCRRRAYRLQVRPLLTESLQMHEDFLRRLIDVARQAGSRSGSLPDADLPDLDLRECVVLVADDDPATATGIAQALGENSGYRVVGVQNGGEALDYAGRGIFHLALVRDGLPDLPSSIVAKSLRVEANEAIVVRFSHPSAGRPGRADIIESQRSLEFIPSLSSGAQLIEHIHLLREGLVAKRRERYHLQAFRADNDDLLRRYADLRQKLVTFLDEEGD